MVPKHTAIAEVDGVSNCVAIDGDFVGDIMLIGPGAGAGPTASSVTSDLIDIARGHILPPFGTKAKDLKPYKKAADARATRAATTSGCRSMTAPARSRRSPSRMAEQGISLESIVQRRPRAELPGINRRTQGLAGRRGHDHPSDHRGRDPQGAWPASSATAMSMQSRR